MRHLVIYHKSCPDGFGAALALKVFFEREHQGEDVEFFAANHGDPVPAVEDKHVYIVDFAYNRETTKKIHEQANTLIVVDHHKSAEEYLIGLPYCIFDMSRSGAMMAWQHFNPEQPVPKLIEYIQDKDIWTWQLPQSKEYSAGLALYPFDFERWKLLLNDNTVPEVIEKGRVILQYETQLLKRAIAKGVRMVYVAGHHVPILNSTILASEIGNELAIGHPFAVTYFDTADKRIFSLRSAKDGVDVSNVAKQFPGGGGHFHAAGFSLPLTQIDPYGDVVPAP